jgi:hypothetical protein
MHVQRTDEDTAMVRFRASHGAWSTTHEVTMTTCFVSCAVTSDNIATIDGAAPYAFTPPSGAGSLP